MRNEGSNLSRLVPSVSHVVICVSQAFSLTDKEKRETACSLAALEKKLLVPRVWPLDTYILYLTKQVC